MALYTYLRDGVPFGEQISLEVQYTDIAGNNKDLDESLPEVQILDADGVEVRAESSTNVVRLGTGHYKLLFEVPALDDGFTAGTWNDIWVGTMDGYGMVSTFDFEVSSVGGAEATGTDVEPLVELGDDPSASYTQHEIKNINILLKLLKARLRNNASKPDGTPCNVFADDDLIVFLHLGLEDFNVMPVISGYTFEDDIIVSLFGDLITQYAQLVAWSSQAVLESGREVTLTDNGLVVQPAPVSAVLNTQYSAQLADYRARVTFVKKNLRSGPRGLGSGRIPVQNSRLRALAHRRENQII